MRIIIRDGHAVVLAQNFKPAARAVKRAQSVNDLLRGAARPVARRIGGQRIADVESEQKQRVGKRGKLAEYLETLKNQGLISSFNETLWYGTVEQVRVLKDGKLRFIFKDGSMVDC